MPGVDIWCAKARVFDFAPKYATLLFCPGRTIRLAPGRGLQRRNLIDASFAFPCAGGDDRNA